MVVTLAVQIKALERSGLSSSAKFLLPQVLCGGDLPGAGHGLGGDGRLPPVSCFQRASNIVETRVKRCVVLTWFG